MATYKVVDADALDAKFTAIANAIRGKNGETGKYDEDAMPAKIAAIETGTDTSDANAAATDIAKDKTAYVNGAKVTGLVDEVTGQYTGSVSGRAAVSNYLYIEGGSFTKDMLFRKNSYMQYSDSLSNYGDAATSDVVKGKTFTSTAGLKKTGTVEEVTGTHYCSPNDASKIVNELCFSSPVESDVLLRGGSIIETDVPISDFGDAAVANVLSGKTFTSSAGYKREGTMANQGAQTASLNTSTTSYTIPAGYHNGSGKVSITTQEKSVTPSSSAQTITPDSGKVLSKVIVAAASGGKEVKSGSFTVSSASTAKTIDTGVTLSSSDIFLMVAVVNASGSVNVGAVSGYKNGSINAVSGIAMGMLVGLGSNPITYSGSSVKIAADAGLATGVTYYWYLIKG